MDRKAENIHYLALYRNALQIPDSYSWLITGKLIYSQGLNGFICRQGSITEASQGSCEEQKRSLISQHLEISLLKKIKTELLVIVAEVKTELLIISCFTLIIVLGLLSVWLNLFLNRQWV